MKKLLCLILAVALILSLSACGGELFVKRVAGTWSCRLEKSQENTLTLLKNFDFYEEEIALVNAPLYAVKYVEFNEDMTYRYYYDVQQEKAFVREFFLAVFEALYAGRSTLTTCYQEDLSGLSKDEFFQFYADNYKMADFDALINTFVDSAYNYEILTDTDSGTYTVGLNRIIMDASGEDFDGSVEYEIEDNTLTLIYSDGTEVYTKVNSAVNEAVAT